MILGGVVSFEIDWVVRLITQLCTNMSKPSVKILQAKGKKSKQEELMHAFI